MKYGNSRKFPAFMETTVSIEGRNGHSGISCPVSIVSSVKGFLQLLFRASFTDDGALDDRTFIDTDADGTDISRYMSR